MNILDGDITTAVILLILVAGYAALRLPSLMKRYH